MQLPQLTTHLPRKSRHERAERRRAARAQDAPPAREAPQARVAAEHRDARRGGGPQDRALYTCSCGYAWTTAVSTSVECPHCRAEQAW
jgi:hypothetical protein